MKHSKKVLFYLMFLFLLSQIIGLLVVFIDLELVVFETEEGEVSEVVFGDTAVGSRPNIFGTQTLFAIAFGVFLGTLILLFLSKLKKFNVWRHWFFFAVVITMSISFGALINNYFFAWILAFFLGAWKVYKPNFLVHNLTELFVYPGIALLLVPLLNVFYAFILLILISVYDAYAVWKSKHMITIAEFAKKSNLFPGLTVSYDSNSGEVLKEFGKKNADKKNSSYESREVRSGILGGGDIAFPLIFSSVLLVSLIQKGVPFFWALFFSFLVSLFSAVALFLLFTFGKRDKYYPAMPFISVGVFVGYLFVLFLLLFF